jgi:hypothetical protein
MPAVRIAVALQMPYGGVPPSDQRTRMTLESVLNLKHIPAGHGIEGFISRKSARIKESSGNRA